MKIQWYPGHMAKAKRKMKEDLPLVDAIIEVIDSRCPNSSRNPEIDILAKDKARIMLFNKADLADPARTKSFMESFQKQGFYTMEMDARSRSSVKGVNKLVMESCAELLERKKQKGILSQSIKAMVLGIPNVGKSTFINNMIISDMRAGNGLCLLDPHGELVDDLLEYIPPNRINDVILFDV